MVKKTVIFVSCIVPVFAIAQNLPVVLVHGIFSDKYSMIPTEQYLKKYMPDVYVKNITIGKGKTTSFCNMYDQVEWLKQDLQADEQLKDGCIIIAHSQGGLVSRYFIERYNNPRVYIYIAWGSPQQGVFGTPGTLDSRFLWLNIMEDYAYKILYASRIQQWISFASYWRDPLHYERYLKKCCFLPYLNNELDHAYADLFKENICSLHNMVLVESTAEEIIEPAESCHFGFYKIGSDSEIEHLFDSALYQEDKLGLKTLAKSGRLHLKFAHCTHTDFQEDEQNFVENTLPFLKMETPTKIIKNNLFEDNM